MSQLEAGPVLDALVAQALWPECTVGMCASSGCGLPAGQTAESDPDVLAVWKANGERTWIPLPPFSTDWNAAMAAAEAAGLFQAGHPLQFREGQWRVCLLMTHPQAGDYCHDSELLGEGDSGQLAICRAILALKGITWPVPEDATGFLPTADSYPGPQYVSTYTPEMVSLTPGSSVGEKSR